MQLIVSIRMPVSALWAFGGIFAPEIKRAAAENGNGFLLRSCPLCSVRRLGCSLHGIFVARLLFFGKMISFTESERTANGHSIHAERIPFLRQYPGAGRPELCREGRGDFCFLGPSGAGKPLPSSFSHVSSGPARERLPYSARPLPALTARLMSRSAFCPTTAACTSV